MNKPIRCTTHFHACDCREYEFEKVKRQLEIQTKRVENLKKSNEFYAKEESWVRSNKALFTRIMCFDVSPTTNKTVREVYYKNLEVGGKLARSCQEIDQELEKELENLK